MVTVLNERADVLVVLGEIEPIRELKRSTCEGEIGDAIQLEVPKMTEGTFVRVVRLSLIRLRICIAKTGNRTLRAPTL